jgi:hypothetical protein
MSATLAAAPPAFLNRGFAASYALKLLRWLCAWTSAYTARVIFFERFVRQTIVARRSPPSLISMLWIFLGLQLAAEAVIILALTLMRNTVPGVADLFDQRFVSAYLADTVGTLAVLVAVAATAARAMSLRGRFDFANEGSRALRAYQNLLVTLAGLFFLVPFFLLVPV